MEHKYIKDLNPNVDMQLEGVYLVKTKNLRVTRDGFFYIQFELVDKSGVISGIKWKATKDEFASVNLDDFIHLKGRVELYQKKLQININSFEVVPESEVDLSYYMPATEKNIEELWDVLKTLAGTIKDEHYGKLVSAFFADEEFCAKFTQAPAAVTYHHAYLGGLLEHTANVAELAELLCSKYPEVNRDLLLTGAILHDIGKIQELQYQRSFVYSDKGGLIGHLVIAIEMIADKITEIPDFPETKKIYIDHLILSHHGEHEWGSPKLPMMLESVVLHYLDNLDAKINAFDLIVKSSKDAESSWTDWSRMFERKLYKKEYPGNNSGEYSDDTVD